MVHAELKSKEYVLRILVLGSSVKKVEMREIEVFAGMNEGLKWVLSGEYGPPMKKNSKMMRKKKKKTTNFEKFETAGLGG